MKMIFAVTFLGILMHVFAQECELMPAEDNIDTEKYFSIPHVYVTHSREDPKETVCREYKTTKNGDGTTNTLVISDYKTGGKHHHTELTCTNTPKPDSKGHFISECEVLGASSTNKIYIETSVFATDNEKYALLQTCTKIGSAAKYNVLVMQTNKDGVDPGVSSVFKGLKWSIDKWHSRGNVNCEDVKK